MKNMKIVIPALIGLLLLGCKKEELKSLQSIETAKSQVEQSGSKEEYIEREDVKQILAGYVKHIKNRGTNTKNLGIKPLEISQRVATNIMEVVLNSKWAKLDTKFNYVDREYSKLLDFSISSSENLLDMFVQLNEVYKQIDEVGKQLDALAGETSKKIFLIDIEPYRFANGQLYFAITVITAHPVLAVAPYSGGYGLGHRNVEYDWQVGNDEPNTCGVNSWSDVSEAPSANGYYYGAVGNITAWFDEYFKHHPLTACHGYINVQNTTKEYNYTSHPQYWGQAGVLGSMLPKMVPNLKFECVSSAIQKNGWIPMIFKLLEDEKLYTGEAIYADQSHGTWRMVDFWAQNDWDWPEQNNLYGPTETVVHVAISRPVCMVLVEGF
jgi:hypothetical protein